MSRSAAAAFVARYGLTVEDAVSLLYPYAKHLTGHRPDAEDMLHGFLEKRLADAVRGTGGPTRIDHPRAYLRRGLANHYRDELRRSREDADGLEPDRPGPAPPATDDTVHWEWVRAVVGEGDARLLWFRSVAGLTQEQVGDRLGLAPSTVGDRLRRALRRLRDDLENGGAA